MQTVADAGAAQAWSTYVEGHARGTVFHHPAWCESVQRCFGHRQCHLVSQRAGRTVGVLPLHLVRSPLAGRLLVSVPYGAYGGILADDDAARDALVTAAVELGGRERARLIELRSATADVPQFGAHEGYLAFVRDLPLHPNEMAKFLPRKARAAARQAAQRDGVEVRHDADLLPVVWQLYCRSMRRLGSLNYPLSLFTELRQRMGERLWVTLVSAGGRPVTGTISLAFRDTVMPYVVGADERIRCDGAANLVYLAVAERAVRAGLRRFDFGRSRADNAGPVSFKKNQGFTSVPLGYQRHVPDGAAAPDLKPTNPRFAWVRRMWPRLPLPVTRALGTRLSRWVPG